MNFWKSFHEKNNMHYVISYVEQWFLSSKDQAHFFTIAYGSLMEVLAQMDVACDLGYISNDEFNEIEKLIDTEAKLLTGLATKCKSLNSSGNAAFTKH